ncbi:MULTISPECIES: hypothetical protein [Haloferax]|nr:MULTISPECIES: hypothetical protein [Haloferax]
MALVSGCLGGGSGPTTLDPASNQADVSSGDQQTATESPDNRSTPESTPEPTPEPTAEATPEPVPESSPEDRIDFTRDPSDPDVVGTLLTKGPIPGVVVSSDLPFATAWQNYAKVDEETGTYSVGLSVTTQSSIGRLSVVGTVFDESGARVSADTDVSNNIPGGEKALIHLVFDGDVEKMYYFEVALETPK